MTEQSNGKTPSNKHLLGNVSDEALADNTTLTFLHLGSNGLSFKTIESLKAIKRSNMRVIFEANQFYKVKN